MKDKPCCQISKELEDKDKEIRMLKEDLDFIYEELKVFILHLDDKSRRLEYVRGYKLGELILELRGKNEQK
jgi:hypothetical protein